MAELTGWLLDLYPDARGAALWLLGDDGQRRRLNQPCPVTCYAAGPPPRLRALWRHLAAGEVPVRLARASRRDLFRPDPIPVLAAQAASPDDLPPLFREMQNRFPDLDYYDADIPLSLRHAAAHGTFPLARCRVALDEAGLVRRLSILDSPWELDPAPPPLRILRLEPDCEPAHAPPRHLIVRLGNRTYRFPFAMPRPLLINLRALFLQHDPDLLLTTYGDTWLLPRLIALASQWEVSLPLNRDENRQAVTLDERTYFSYGQIVYRGQQVHLFGRWHIDCDNALLFNDYDLEGIYEFARLTSLPVQTAARVSPGTGISSMQIVTALRNGILVPWRKQQPERPKSALDLLHRDLGGLVYQPLVGVHEHVAGVDFVSMYPSLMVRFNISPETAGDQPGNPAALEPFAGAPGLVPQTLAPLLEKRLALKARQAELPRWDARRRTDKARSSAHKWLLVTCFGYLGYKNARFGRIEAHEAVTAYGREALLRAKEAAEDMGCTILHLYVDGLWVKNTGWSEPEDFQPLLAAILERTGLSIGLEGIYRWIAFLPSRADARVPVPNRYFGVFQIRAGGGRGESALKVRGIECRRRDTPPWVARAQVAVLECLAQAETLADIPGRIPEALGILQAAWRALRAGRVPLEDLLISQRLSRVLDEYRTRSPVARAVAQLLAAGKGMKPGQRVQFVHTRGRPGIHAWGLPQAPCPAAIDHPRYAELLVRAGHTVLQVFGLSQPVLRALVLEKQPAFQFEIPDRLSDEMDSASHALALIRVEA